MFVLINHANKRDSNKRDSARHNHHLDTPGTTSKHNTSAARNSNSTSRYSDSDSTRLSATNPFNDIKSSDSRSVTTNPFNHHDHDNMVTPPPFKRASTNPFDTTATNPFDV